MNRTEFMSELERLLWDLPESERREALQYYNDYFHDAGPENEAQVIKELGSPAQVAKTIREGMSENGEYTEHGYEDARFRSHQEVAAADYHAFTQEKNDKTAKQSPNLWKLLSILLLCLLLFPIIVPLCLVLIAIPIAILAGTVGVVTAAVIVAVILPIAGIILVGVAFYNLFFTPVVGITLAGVGFLLLALGILTLLLAVWIFKSIFPLCIRSTISIFRYPFRKAGIVK